MILIDAGYYAGIATKKYIDQVDKVYAFEPNPEIEDYGNPPLIRKAVWIEDGEMEFMIGGRHDAGHLKDMTSCGDISIGKVQTIDFSKFVRELPDEEIICSMDIEGAEWKVLNKMIKDGTIKKIKILDIEMHHRLSNEYTKEQAEELVKKLEDLGVEVILKVPL